MSKLQLSLEEIQEKAKKSTERFHKQEENRNRYREICERQIASRKYMIGEEAVTKNQYLKWCKTHIEKPSISPTGIKVNEQYRELYPEVAKSLEAEGQQLPILIDEYGYVHDGMKRLLLLGPDNVKKKIVSVVSECSNHTKLTYKQKHPLVVLAYRQLTKPSGVSRETRYTEGSPEAIEQIMRRYNLSRATTYRMVNPEYYNELVAKRERKRKQAETNRLIKEANLWELNKSKREFERREALKEQLEKKVLEEELAVQATNTECIDTILNWLSSENPKITEEEKIFMNRITKEKRVLK